MVHVYTIGGWLMPMGKVCISVYGSHISSVL